MQSQKKIAIQTMLALVKKMFLIRMVILLLSPLLIKNVIKNINKMETPLGVVILTGVAQ